MLTNDQMIPNRFARMARARRVYNFIKTQAEAGRTVCATNYATQTRITAKHLPMVRLTKMDVLVQRGKHWDSILGCKITAH